MQQHLLQTTVHAHVFVLCQVLEQSGKTLLQPHRHVYAFNLDRRPGVEQVMPKREMVSIQVTHAVVSDSVFPVVNLGCDFNSVGAMECIELVRIADEEGYGASFGIGRSL